MITVINVFASLNSGGAENRTMDVYRKIDKSKYQFDFISVSTVPNQYFENEILSLGGRIIKLSSPREIGIMAHIRDLIEVFKGYDSSTTVVHSHSLYHSGIVLYAAKKAGIKVRIAHARASQSSSKGIKNEIFIAIGKYLIKKYATHRLAVSAVAGDFLFGGNYTIIPNAIDIDRYVNFSDDERRKYKKEFSISNNDVIVGHVGRFETEKNHQFIINRFAEFHTNHPQSRLILVGNGTLRNEIERLVASLHLKDSVILTGVRRDANRIMNMFDVVLFPSIFEGLPGVILELQAAGVPSILSTNITQEVDLGLGLVTYLPLEDSALWLNAISNFLCKESFSTLEERRKAFNNRGLSIEAEIKELTHIYSSVIS